MNLNQYATSTAQPGLSVDKIKRLELPFVPYDEQTAIAQYLDTKTQAVDKKISLLTQKIDYYKQLRKTLINDAVTKGLNKEVEMKDSGIEWIGKIPKHWEVKRLKDISIISSGDSITNSELIDQGYEVFGGNGLMGYTDKFNVSGESLVIGRVGAYCGNVRYINERKWISDNALILKAKARWVNNIFLTYNLRNLNLGSLSTSTAQPLVTSSKLLGIEFFLPPKKEQTQIANYLDKKTSIIDSITDNLQTQIQTLQELRKTLINDVVTGKVKVVNDEE